MELTREHILKAVREGEGRYTKRDLVRTLGLSGDERRDLNTLLKDMVRQGQLIKSERKTYRTAESLPSVAVLSVERIDDSGDLIAQPAKWDAEGEPPEILILEEKGKGARAKHMYAKLGLGDRVLCKLTKTKRGYIAHIIRLLGKAPRLQLGVVVRGGRGLRIRPVEKGSRYDHLPERGVQLKEGDLVRYSLSSARHKGDRIARIVETLGRADGPKAASLISLYAHNIPTGFSQDELQEAQTLKLPTVSKYREDLRDLAFVTIDPVDAKDFDDAIYAHKDDDAQNPGGFIVWVAIADVSAFVTPGSSLDKTAFKKGNSVYLPDRVEPMLPERLSADLCSLRPHEDRACLAVRMRFDKTGVKTGHKFVRGLMCSHARLTYAQVQKVFEGQREPSAKNVRSVLEDIWAAYEVVREARHRRGPLEIDMPERKVKLDTKGRVVAIEVRERFDAHKLVEEFMIQANVAAAEALDKKNAPLIYRVHEPPSYEKIQGLADFLPALGLKWTMGERVTPKRFNRLIEMAKAKDKDLIETISMSVLRSQMQAYYSPKNGGHFGLNLTHYAHFTSPIRRYADLVVHRALIGAFGLGAGGISDEEISRLQEISEHISDTERKAMAAERDATDRYIAAYLAGRVNEDFEGHIAGVTRAGLFVQLRETGADGFVPISSLGLERFICDEKSKSLIGAETGGTYKFGAKVRVRLLEAMPLKGGLIFEMLSKPEKGKIPKRSGRNNRGRKYGHKRGNKPRRRRH
ncbi:MAG TPA: ribonuclease R [Hellea balneolensis]|uniref:Ribonuclease R n=1 Tax=Hellea balneolensis TaxID=287478 RepID=A0A7C5QP59_9PROT|nr:ribonuclease R [Hellea balneolensis]